MSNTRGKIVKEEHYHKRQWNFYGVTVTEISELLGKVEPICSQSSSVSTLSTWNQRRFLIRIKASICCFGCCWNTLSIGSLKHVCKLQYSSGVFGTHLLQFWSGQYLENKTELCWPLLVLFGQSFANPPSPKVVNWLKRNRSWNSTNVHKTCFQIRFLQNAFTRSLWEVLSSAIDPNAALLSKTMHNWVGWILVGVVQGHLHQWNLVHHSIVQYHFLFWTLR